MNRFFTAGWISTGNKIHEEIWATHTLLNLDTAHGAINCVNTYVSKIRPQNEGNIFNIKWKYGE